MPRQCDLLGGERQRPAPKYTDGQRLSGEFRLKWAAKFGEPYNWLVQDGAMMKRLAKIHGYDVVSARIDAYLNWDDRVADDAGYPAFGFERWWPRLAAALRREPDLRRVRASRFCARYAELFAKHRRGAQYMPQANDITKAVELCAVWDDARLERLAVVFLKTDHEFAQGGSRTLGQFAVLASWCDDRLREVEGA